MEGVTRVEECLPPELRGPATTSSPSTIWRCWPCFCAWTRGPACGCSNIRVGASPIARSRCCASCPSCAASGCAGRAGSRRRRGPPGQLRAPGERRSPGHAHGGRGHRRARRQATSAPVQDRTAGHRRRARQPRGARRPLWLQRVLAFARPHARRPGRSWGGCPRSRRSSCTSAPASPTRAWPTSPVYRGCASSPSPARRSQPGGHPALPRPDPRQPQR
jgi:hypothetical protein